MCMAGGTGRDYYTWVGTGWTGVCFSVGVEVRVYVFIYGYRFVRFVIFKVE